jgi:hypothetical protein
VIACPTAARASAATSTVSSTVGQASPMRISTVEPVADRRAYQWTIDASSSTPVVIRSSTTRSYSSADAR